jgi:hypothetical protein
MLLLKYFSFSRLTHKHHEVHIWNLHLAIGKMPINNNRKEREKKTGGTWWRRPLYQQPRSAAEGFDFPESMTDSHLKNLNIEH